MLGVMPKQMLGLTVLFVFLVAEGPEIQITKSDQTDTKSIEI